MLTRMDQYRLPVLSLVFILETTVTALPQTHPKLTLSYFFSLVGPSCFYCLEIVPQYSDNLVLRVVLRVISLKGIMLVAGIF